MNETRIAGEDRLWFWIPSGGDGTDADDTGDDAGGDDDGGEPTDADDGDTDADDQDDDVDPKAALKKLQDQYNRIKNHLRSADQGRSKAQKELDELRRKERTDLENAQADLTKEREARESWETRFRSMAVTNAFLIESARAKLAWHDPEVAQHAAGLKDLEIDEDGSVAGMAEAVKKLAKDKPFLVNGEGDAQDTGRKGKTGSPVGSGSAGKGKPNGELTNEELAARFPALRR